jgi:hypothetical protein
LDIYNSNLILNTRVYLAEFPDGTVSEYAANIIAEAIYEQVNDDGYDTVIFSHIIGHDYAPTKEVVTPFSKSTKGWSVCVEWKDGTTAWHPMTEIKNTFPIQLAEYAMANNLQDKPG